MLDRPGPLSLPWSHRMTTRRWARRSILDRRSLRPRCLRVILDAGGSTDGGRARGQAMAVRRVVECKQCLAHFSAPAAVVFENGSPERGLDLRCPVCCETATYTKSDVVIDLVDHSQPDDVSAATTSGGSAGAGEEARAQPSS